MSRKKTAEELREEEKIRREYTEWIKFRSHKNMLHVKSYEYLVTEDFETAKKNLREYYKSLPSKIRNHPHFDKAFTKLIERRA